MSVLNQYVVDLAGLKNQEYQYEFSIQDDFFRAMETDLLEKGNLKAIVDLRKSESILQLDFLITGTIELTCDRSLELFDYPVAVKERLIIQFGDHEETIDDELEVLAYGTQALPLAQYLYEYVAMAIPFKRLHPKFADEADEDEESEVKLIYSSSSDAETEDDQPVDDRWEALKKLNKN